MSQSLISQMFRVLRQNPDCLVAYEDDFLVHDANIIKDVKGGQRLIWIIRDHGTHLYNLDAHTGDLSMYAKAVLQSEGVKRIYLIEVSKAQPFDHPQGDLKEINKEAARFLLEAARKV